MPNLLDITIEDGAYIYSTSEAFPEEQKIDTLRLFNWLNYFNLKPSHNESIEIYKLHINF